MIRMRTILVLALAVLFLTATAWAQATTGTLTGTVTDPNGASIPNAKVTALNTGTGQEAKTTTNDLGLYRFVDQQPGMYSVTVEATGFRRAALSPQRLVVADTLRLDVTLEIGALTETVTVDTRAPQVNIEDSQLGHTLTQIPELPILSGNAGRNPLALVGLQPGVVTLGGGATVGPFEVNGQRSQSNNFLLDGGDANDLAINIPDAVQQISPNALGEFRVITGAMKAEYGRNSGSVVEVITKSGTNAYHGQATEIFRNTVLNATPFFQNVSPGPTDTFTSGLKRKPQFNVNDFDANFGGRIIRDKTFFFISYLGFRRRQGVTSSATVFTDAQRALIQSGGNASAIALLNLIPRASTGSTLFSSPSNKLDRDQGLAKLDHRFSDRNVFSGSLFKEVQRAVDPFAFGGSLIPGFGTAGATTFTNITLRDSQTFSPSVVNEAFASYHQRASPGVLPLNTATPASLGFTGIIPDDPTAAGPPNIRISGISQFGNTIQGPQARSDNTWQYSDNLSWVHGRHFFKFGVDYKAYEQNQVFDFENNGVFIINGFGTANGLVPVIPGLSRALNDFAHGFAIQVQQSNANRQGYRDRFFAGYAQDDFKVTRNFTLNIGVRYEYGAPLTELHDRVATFRAGQQSTVFPDAPVGLVYPGDKGISRSTYSPDRNNFAPRFGFAWDPSGNGKLSIRGGVGMFYNVPESELTLQFLGQAPFGIGPVEVAVTDFTHPFSSSLQNPVPQPFPFTPVARGGHFDFTGIAPVGLTIMDPNFRTPYSMQWSLQVQYQLAKDWLADAAYVGSNGRKLLNRREINPGLIQPGATDANTDNRRVLNQGNPQNDAFGGAVFGGITDQLTDSNSSYHSLQLNLEKRFGRGLAVTQAYTWAHSIDDASGLRTNSNPFSRSYDRGNSDNDVRHRYVGSVIYEVPWGKGQKGFVGHVLGGFTVSSVVTAQTGLPFDIIELDNRSLSGAGDDRPDFLGGKVQFADPRSNAFGKANSLFNGTGGGDPTAAGNPFFRRVGSDTTLAAGAGRYGTLGRNVFHGPGLFNTDLSIGKKVRITEGSFLELRGEGFNVWNHTQFNNPGATTGAAIGSTTFGQITSARDPRLIQITARIVF
jgi:hypothetical protein